MNRVVKPNAFVGTAKIVTKGENAEVKVGINSALVYANPSLLKNVNPKLITKVILYVSGGITSISIVYVSTVNGMYVYSAEGFGLQNLKLFLSGKCTNITPTKTLYLTPVDKGTTIVGKNKNDGVIFMTNTQKLNNLELVKSLSFKKVIYPCKFLTKTSDGYSIFYCKKLYNILTSDQPISYS